MRVYRGCWGEDGRIAYVQDGNSISALGGACRVGAVVEWGTSSPGTTLLARAILEHAGLAPASMDRLLPAFAKLLARMPRHGFALSENELRAWIIDQVECRDGMARDANRSA